jgi:hypothetical protein
MARLPTTAPGFVETTTQASDVAHPYRLVLCFDTSPLGGRTSSPIKQPAPSSHTGRRQAIEKRNINKRSES